MHKIVAGLIRENEGRKVPVTLFTKGGGMWLEAMAETGCDALGVDWTVNLAQAKARVGHKVALQGNMDPSVLYASPARIEQEVRSIWRILVRDLVMCSILVMVFIKMCQNKAQRCLLTRFINFLNLIINNTQENYAKPYS